MQIPIAQDVHRNNVTMNARTVPNELFEGMMDRRTHSLLLIASKRMHEQL